MEILVRVLRVGTDWVLAPFLWLPLWLGLSLLSALLGVVLLIAFGWVSPQRMLRRVKDRMLSTVYEMRLFADSPRLIIAALGRALTGVSVYLALMLPALLILFPVVGLLLVRAATVYDYRPLLPGETALVSVELNETATDVDVTAQGGLAIKPPVLTIDSLGKAVFRVTALEQGTHAVSIRSGSDTTEKRIVVSKQASDRVSPVRAAPGSFAGLLSLEPAVAANAFGSIWVDYPTDSLSWLSLPWYVWLFAISMAAAFALRNRFDVTF